MFLNKNHPVFIPVLAAFVGIGLLACSPPGSNETEPDSSSLATPAPEPEPTAQASEPGGRFMLRDHNQRIVTDQDFQGKFLLISFGYTTCPDICPTTLIKMADVTTALGENAKDLDVLFITVDPDRDTPEILRDYVTSFGDDFIGLTGSTAVIQSVTQKYRVKYAYPGKDSAEDMDYTVDHTSSVFFMGPDGKFIRRFTFVSQAPEIAEHVQKTMQEFMQTLP